MLSIFHIETDIFNAYTYSPRKFLEIFHNLSQNHTLLAIKDNHLKDFTIRKRVDLRYTLNGKKYI